MLIHVVTRFCVSDRGGDEAFVRFVREWQPLARRIAPDLIATDLLRHDQEVPAPLYLCLDFWTSVEAYRRALRSGAIQQLLRARREMAFSSFELGAFAFPIRKEAIGPNRTLVN
jgi:hypothetical protein